MEGGGNNNLNQCIKFDWIVGLYFVFCVWNWELFSFFVFNQIQLKMEFE